MKEMFKEEELVKILKNSLFNQKYMITLKIKYGRRKRKWRI